MIVSPPKTGKTTLLKQIAKAVTVNNPDMNLIILLIDERPGRGYRYPGVDRGRECGGHLFDLR